MAIAFDVQLEFTKKEIMTQKLSILHSYAWEYKHLILS